LTVKKIYCEILEGVTYSDRCLFKLSKVIEGNAACESCILRELERLRSAGAKAPNDKDNKDNIDNTRGRAAAGVRSGREIKGRKSQKRLKKKPRSIESETSNHMYSVGELSKVLGKAERTLQGWAQEGKIPAVRVGIRWCFPREEIAHWLSEKKGTHLEAPGEKGEEESPELEKADFLHANQGEPEKDR
jgi:excisionase family DNA binding protein